MNQACTNPCFPAAPPPCDGTCFSPFQHAQQPPKLHTKLHTSQPHKQHLPLPVVAHWVWAAAAPLLPWWHCQSRPLQPCLSQPTPAGQLAGGTAADCCCTLPPHRHLHWAASETGPGSGQRRCSPEANAHSRSRCVQSWVIGQLTLSGDSHARHSDKTMYTYTDRLDSRLARWGAGRHLV